MLGSVLGKAYRNLVGRLLGLDAIVEQKLPPLVRRKVDAALLGFIAGETGGRGATLDVDMMSRVLATASSARFFAEHMRMARNLIHAETLLRYALKHCTLDGLVLEFGVFRGASLSVIAQNVDAIAYGFDSFEGLPEDWSNLQRKGQFSLDGKLPRFDETNVELVAGWFSETLPGFLAAHPGPARFIHVDADLYSSAVTVLTQLAPRIVPGTVIQFDEYFNYPGWEHHEHKAFTEFVAATGVRFEYLGFASSQSAVAVKIL